MKTWIIGDVQGCFHTLMALLKQCDFQPQDRLWFAGDLINRGPRSLETLDWVYRHRDNCTVVLGNHDLHLLMCGQGLRAPKKSDTLDDILASPDCRVWLDWLRHCPLLHQEGDDLMVHAGLLPGWSLSEAIERAHAVDIALRGDDHLDFLQAMNSRGDESSSMNWQDHLETVAVMTRVRMLDSSQKPQFGYKGEPENAPRQYSPWFESAHARSGASRVFFGHWAALGHRVFPGYVALDSGCVWKNKLTAFCLEDSKVYQQAYCE